MNVHQVRPDYAYGTLNPLGEYEDRERWRNAAGKPSLDTWQAPIALDCIMSSVPAGRGILLNARARAVLGPLLLSCGEYLPVHVEGLDYQWFDCTTMIDVADQENIEGTHEESPHIPSYLWKSIKRWAFHEDLVAAAPPVFSAPQGRGVMLMSTDLLKQAVEEHEVLGFAFKHLWSSETGGTELVPEVFFGPAGKERADAVKQRRERSVAARRQPCGQAGPTRADGTTLSLLAEIFLDEVPVESPGYATMDAQSHASFAAGTAHQLLGHMNTLQEEPRVPGQRLLLQFDSDLAGPGWMWGDGGILWSHIPEQALATGQFEACASTWSSC